MVFNIERDLCSGRSFSSANHGGYLYHFKNWIDRTAVENPVSGVKGGPGWHIIDDHSGDVSDAYIVVSNHDASTVYNFPNSTYIIQDGTAYYPNDGSTSLYEPHKIFKVSAYDGIPGHITVEGYLWWDSSTSTGRTQWSGFDINTLDAADFIYDFRGGPELLAISSRTPAGWEQAYIEDWEGDPELLESQDTTAVMQRKLSLSDPGWSSGNDATIEVENGISSNFTVGHNYYLYDLQFSKHGGNTDNWFHYVTIMDTSNGADGSNDSMVISASYKDFPEGSVLCSYVHRYLSAGDDADIGTYRRFIPYCSKVTEDSNWERLTYQSAYVALYTASKTFSLYKLAPDDEARYAVQRMGISEYYDGANSSVGMDRGYGYTKNSYLTSITNMEKMLDGREIDGTNYIRALELATPTIQVTSVIPSFNSVE